VGRWEWTQERGEKEGMTLDSGNGKRGRGKRECEGQSRDAGWKDKRGNCNENEDPGRGVEHLN
jgi:hypothetical protein